MYTNKVMKFVGISCITIIFTACSTQPLVKKIEDKTIPASYINSLDSNNTAKISWKDFFTDPNLIALIDTALKNNQELNITIQEIEIARNEIREKKGEYLPFLGARGGVGVDKVGRYTRNGALESNLDILPEKEFPEPFQDYTFGAYATWELDVWRKLRNAKKSAVSRYLASVEGKNFMVTNLVVEIAHSYYELLALDNQLDILMQYIEIQEKALEVVRLQKQAAKVTELAVRRFEAEVFKNKSRQFYIQQSITEAENRINFLVGSLPKPIPRNSAKFTDLELYSIQEGIPAQLLENRPDIRQSEMMLEASKLDVKVAKARFYPSVGITAGMGFQAFNPTYLIKAPQSLLYSLAGDLVAPLVNRNAIKATYYTANAKQIQAVYNYERTILSAYIEVVNQLSKIDNLEKSYDLKSKEVATLTQSITISNKLFQSARADYMEVLLTQRDALDSKIELIETKKMQMNTLVKMYQALGGGWN